VDEIALLSEEERVALHEKVGPVHLVHVKVSECK